MAVLQTGVRRQGCLRRAYMEVFTASRRKDCHVPAYLNQLI